MAASGEVMESLEEIPAHVWKGLPSSLNLGPSAINQNRIGVWATQGIPKGKRFGPFVGEKKKRSQVTSNVYMWEVYFPSRGWMCIDATDPMKGNWLRYVNWARSSKEQNLFPLEINRAIYYKVLKPIRPGEELLVWYTVEDNPEITAALEEERANSLNRKNSHRAKQARRKVLEKARQAGSGGFKTTSGTEATIKEMWDGGEGKPLNEEEDGDDSQETAHQTSQQLNAADYTQSKKSGPSCDGGSLAVSQVKLKSSSVAAHDPDFEPGGELESDAHGESYPCPHCERRFSTRQGLERHAHIHGISYQQAQVFRCQYCNKSFGSQVGRRRHERRHEGGSKKRLGSLAGASSSLISPVAQTDSSPDCTSPATHYIAIGFSGGHVQKSELQRKELGAGAERPLTLEENGESKELHPCKYCNKAFGTHTNMRRHQRRIHERHLLPKGVRRKGMLFQEASMQQRPGESPSTSPPPVYVPSADTEDEADRDDYTVDISKNISENLSFYIDGKIVSTGAVSNCEVIEVDSRSAALFGLDTVIISPNQLSQALKVEARATSAKQISSSGQPAAKRRTSTPPLVTGLKVETETTPSSSSTSSSSKLLVGGIFQQSTDSAAFQREKTVYLSPKLKQLLQTQDFQKSTITLITDSHRLTSPLAVSPLQGASGKFKRRTTSPPSSPQLSPAGKTESCKGDALSAHTLKVPKLESHSVPPPEDVQDQDEDSSSGSGGNSCNQQPLDLSNSVGRQTDIVNKVLGDSALDLSLHCKSIVEPEIKGNSAPQSLTKKRKPNTSMLEKVLMNEYASLTLPAEDGPFALAGLSRLSSCSPNVTSESAHPSPPSLTPVTINPSSPGASSATSPTPPPPVLPTIPSPPAMPSSPLSQPSDSPAHRPLPVLSPKMSPRVDGQKLQSDSENFLDDKDEDENRISDLLDSLNSSLEAPPPSFCGSTSKLNGGTADTEASLKSDSDAALPLSSPSSPPVAQESSLSSVSQSLCLIKVKEEPQSCEDYSPVKSGSLQDGVDSSPLPHPAKTSEAEEINSVYCKSFVCNVCEEPFNSIKELSAHITEHAADWPFKCEFCVQLFEDAPALLAHRTTLHGVGQIFVCSACSKEFAFLCNLQQHQQDLHPNEACSHSTVENGKLRPHNYTDPSRAKEESSPSTPSQETADENAPQTDSDSPQQEPSVNGDHAEDPNEELYTTIKIMASEGGNRSHAGSVASATNFTTHNIPQTFSTAIRCTKCGCSFDNMPELHKHILACASASDKKRYTPKKNPIPLKQIVKSPNGLVSPAVVAGQSAFRRMGQPKRLNFNQDAVKAKMNALSKKRNQLVQKAISQRNKTAATAAKKSFVKTEAELASSVCPHCSREFTYTASLTKHMAVSCPMKPAVAKRGKKGLAEVKKEAVSVLDKNTSKKKTLDPEAQTEVEAKPLVKTRTRSSGGTNTESFQESKRKATAAVGRLKRTALSPVPVSPNKRNKKSQTKTLPPTIPALDPPADGAPRPAIRTSRPAIGKKPAAMKLAETTQQLKKEERFSLRMRERMGGPVTRSSQMANTLPPVEVKKHMIVKPLLLK
uniref:PR domain containing 2, with ZNF domain b n=1 Tax=Oryzias sinensis TaxID=183150 RepID=A0A8C7X3B3_9TELE